MGFSGTVLEGERAALPAGVIHLGVKKSRFPTRPPLIPNWLLVGEDRSSNTHSTTELGEGGGGNTGSYGISTDTARAWGPSYCQTEMKVLL